MIRTDAAMLVPILCAACADSAASLPQGSPQTLTVLAASSLTEAFTDLEQAFEAAHGGVDVSVAFAGSQALATQIRHGIEADVFASASEQHIVALAGDGLVEPPRLFAHNALVLAISDAFPHPVTLETLPTVGSLVVGGDEVPVGTYTRTLFDSAQARFGDDWRSAVEARVVSREPNVRLVVAKLAMGEADAAIVYATDATTTRGVHAVALPTELSTSTDYFQARLAAPTHPELARDWIDFVESPTGREVLTARGFLEQRP